MDRRYFTVYVLFVLLVTSVQGEAEHAKQNRWNWGDGLSVDKIGAAVVVGAAALASGPSLLSVGFGAISATYVCNKIGVCDGKDIISTTIDEVYSTVFGNKEKQN